MAIRIYKKTEKELQRLIRNYNQKITRLQKKDTYSLLYLPEKVTKKDILRNVNSRKELNRVKRDLKAFSQRGVEETYTFDSGFETSIYEAKNLKRNLSSAKRKLTIQLNKLANTKVTEAGEDFLDVSKEQIYRDRKMNLEAKRMLLSNGIAKVKTRKDLDNLKRLVDNVLKDKKATNINSVITRMEDVRKRYNVSTNIGNIYNDFYILSDIEFTNLIENELLIKRILDYYDQKVLSYEENSKIVKDLFLNLKNSWNNIFNTYHKTNKK